MLNLKFIGTIIFTSKQNVHIKTNTMLLTAAYLFQYTWSLMAYQWRYKVPGHAGKRQKKSYFQRKQQYKQSMLGRQMYMYSAR